VIGRIDSSAFAKWLHEAAVELEVRTKEALKHAAETAALHAKQTKRFENRTNALRGSIKPQLVNATHATVTAGARHASWVENGNKPKNASVITPKNGPYLKFFSRGRWWRLRSVKPTAPRPFMRDARNATEPLFERLIREAVDRSFK
jgi:hypothetical protein